VTTRVGTMVAMTDDAAPAPAVDGACRECGFDYDALADADVPDALRTLGRRYRAPLTRGLPGEDLDAVLRAHPLPGVWSALEYGCHLRDVLDVQRARLELTLAEDLPTFEPMGRDERVTRDRYNEQSPAEVVDQIAANAAAIADAFAALTPDQWRRRGIYGYPEPRERDLAWIGRHTAHEGHHHLLDIGRVLRAARGR
jgi:DinB family protein